MVTFLYLSPQMLLLALVHQTVTYAQHMQSKLHWCVPAGMLE